MAARSWAARPAAEPEAAAPSSAARAAAAPAADGGTGGGAGGGSGAGSGGGSGADRAVVPVAVEPEHPDEEQRSGAQQRAERRGRFAELQPGVCQVITKTVCSLPLVPVAVCEPAVAI